MLLVALIRLVMANTLKRRVTDRSVWVRIRPLGRLETVWTNRLLTPTTLNEKLCRHWKEAQFVLKLLSVKSMFWFRSLCTNRTIRLVTFTVESLATLRTSCLVRSLLVLTFWCTALSYRGQLTDCVDTPTDSCSFGLLVSVCKFSVRVR